MNALRDCATSLAPCTPFVCGTPLRTRSEAFVQASTTRPAFRRRSGSRPTTTTSTARPVAANAAHSPACCLPHVRTALAVASSVCTKTNVARSAPSASGSLWAN